MPTHVRPEATLRAYGDLCVDRDEVQPLDTVTVRISGRAKGDERCSIRVEDGELQAYFESEVVLHGNEGTVSFLAAGALGTHWVYLRFPNQDRETPATAALPPAARGDLGEPLACPHYYAPNFGQPTSAAAASRHVRYTNFVLDATTAVRSGDPAFDSLYDITRRRLLLNRRVFCSAGREMAYYCSADTWSTSAAWLRDWIYHLPAARFWERELTGGLERFAQAQEPDGMIPDYVRFDGSTGRMSVESDVEYIAVMAVWGVWRITGDATWVSGKLEMLERALQYVKTDPLRWDDEWQLVTRGHTCDTWDFEIGGLEAFVEGRKVIATCDQSGYVLAYTMMAEMYRALGHEDAARRHADEAHAYRRRANARLWDGGKYLHHIHRTPLVHPGFDETEQLAAGNTWAMTRGLADAEQAAAIIAEYERRHEATGDAFPWWSLQPGYPDHLNYWPGLPHCVQGGYANGGLLPYVGGELCRACFEFGRESYGLDLLRQYLDQLRDTGDRVYVWYWPNGEPGMRTANEVPRNGWGMAEWLTALLEGLAGVKDTAPRLAGIRLSPRWAATDRRAAYVSVRYEANDAYFAYRLKRAPGEAAITIEYTGSGQEVEVHLLLPAGSRAQRVSAAGQALPFSDNALGTSRYVDFRLGRTRFGRVEIELAAAPQV
jgi:hypothetical protein